MREQLTALVSNPRVAGAVSASTLSVGAVVEMIPTDIGKVAAVVGIILSAVIIRMNLIATRKIRLELEIMQRREADRLAQLERRIDVPADR